MVYAAPNVTNMSALFTYANTVTDGLFWQLILMAVYIVTFISLSGRAKTSECLASSGFFTGIVAVIMFIMGLIGEIQLIVAIVLALGGFVMLLFSK